MTMTSTYSLRCVVPFIGTLCLLTAGCVQDDLGSKASLEQTIAGKSSDMMALAPSREIRSRPIVSLPGEDGDIESVRTRSYMNGLRQDIILKHGAIRPTQNSITILARTNDRQTLDESVPLYKPTEDAIRSEIGGQFPHVPMQIVDRESQNDYGPYGLALGRAAGDIHCLYMWQWIDKDHLPPDVGLMGPVSVRVRLCQSGTTFDEMSARMDHLSINGSQSIETASGDDRIHIIEAPVSATPSEPIHHARRQHHIIRAAHHDAPAVETAQVEPGAPRYMASSPLTPSRSQVTAETAVANSSKLPADLPPQAYLGPKAANAY